MLYLRIALIALCLPVPLAAEERSARFLTLMSCLPDGVMANRARATPEFVDFDAMRSVLQVLGAAGSDEVDPDGLRSIGGPLAKVPQGQDWTGKVGFARSDVRAAAETGDPTDRGMVLLLSADVAQQVGPALVANDYALDDGRGFPIYWRGADGQEIDPAYRSPADPFTYPLPLSSRIALDGDILLQSSSWSSLEAMFAAAGTSAVLATFGQVLDAPDWGAAQLIQATIFSDPAAFAPPFQVTQDLVPVDTPPGGIPSWSNLMLADLSDGAHDLTLIAVIYVARSDAEEAAGAMQAGLGSLALVTFGGETLDALVGPGRAMVVGDGPYAAVYAVETVPEVRTPRMVRNRGFHVLLSAASSGDLPLLGPKLP